MADLVGNALVAQSGGPTVVINASVAGVVQQAGRHPDVIKRIYGGKNGILGVLNEELVDLEKEKRQAIEGLKHCPAAALGTCHYELDFKGRPAEAAKDMERLFDVFMAPRWEEEEEGTGGEPRKCYPIRYFFYIGGNDSQDTALRIHEEALKRGYEMRVIGIPKAVDNDLPHTDHCPGYGSAIKYAATTVLELAMDIGSMVTDTGSCCIIEAMGQDTGWLAAGTVVAKRRPDDAPHIILLPEVTLDEAKFVAKVKATLEAHRYCLVVVGEGLRRLNKEGKVEIMAEDKTWVDAFGHPVRVGPAERLAELLKHNKVDTNTRTVKLGYAQRCAAHFASATDVAEAVACGEAAVRAAVAGQSGFMVKIVREQNNPYKWSMALHDLKDVANVVRQVPRDWLSEDGMMPNEKFIEYARPLIEGEVRLTLEAGLPKYVTLEKVAVDKVLPPRA
jgi:6-phosphofructokinase 1